MNWTLILPEGFFIASTLIGLGCCVRPHLMRSVCWWSLVTACVLSTFTCFGLQLNGQFTELFVMNGLISNYKAFFSIALLVILLFTKRSWFDEDVSDVALILVSLSALGMLAMLSASHLLTIYIGIELMSLPLYALMAMEREDDKSLEASLKYFVTGAIGSGFLLLGFALIYAVTGQMALEAIGTSLSSGTFSGLFSMDMNTLMTGLAVAFIMAAFAFKLGLFPFHSYLPDVYEGVKLEVLILFGTIVKFAAAIAFVKVVACLGSALKFWQPMILLSSLASLAYGNLMALRQTNLRRLLAYSSIAHMGFFVMCCYGLSTSSVESGVFYVMIYALMSFVALGFLFFVQNEKNLTVSDLVGMGKTSVGLASTLMFVMFSMAGIPPLAGFMPKFLIIKELATAHYVVPAVMMVLLTVIALGYYLAIIRNLFFGDKEDASLGTVSRSASSLNILYTGSALILLIGIYPTVLLQFVQMTRLSQLFS